MEHLFAKKKWNVRELFFKRKEGILIPDYEHLSLREEMECFFEGTIVISIFAYFFYRSMIAFVFLTPILYFYGKRKREKVKKSKLESVEIHFKEVLLLIQSNLQAGYSMENAVTECREEIVKMYGDKGDITLELDVLIQGMKNGINLEKGFTHMGKRCGGEINEFAKIYGLSSRMGGRRNEIIEKSTDMITKKIEIKEEIALMIHEKEVEHKIMCVIPFFIMTYMDLTSGGYFQVLYHNIFGVIVMTICMMVYIYAYRIGEKIREI